MKNKINMFWAIVCIVIASAVTIKMMPTKLGLDLVGGSRFLLQAQIEGTSYAKVTPEIMTRLKTALEKRVNPKGVSETLVQITGDDKILIEIPNKGTAEELEDVKNKLGKTAKLEFRKEAPGPNGSTVWIPTDLTGSDLTKSDAQINTAGKWEISLEFNSSGSQKFYDLTQELVGKRMAIFFDDEMLSDPRVNEPIYGGHAVITGDFTAEQSKYISDLLNAGALPIPAQIIEENMVGPTLGADSLAKSKIAGIIGLGLVMIFMIGYYRLPGLIADIALIIYSIILFALFKVMGVTLTLAGIAGFILSVGMAVDANILIFERTKEELRAGRNLFTAINSGFDRAFTSIFDSNMTTIITCTILYFLGSTVVKGFAVTLALGVMVSMFSAITVTKNFMHLIFGTGELKYPALFGLKKDEIGKAHEVVETKREKARFGILD